MSSRSRAPHGRAGETDMGKAGVGGRNRTVSGTTDEIPDDRAENRRYMYPGDQRVDGQNVGEDN